MPTNETGRSSVAIKDTSKGSQVEVKVYAQPAPPDGDVEEAYRRLTGKFESNPSSEYQTDVRLLGEHIGYLRSLIPDVAEAAELALRTHLEVIMSLQRSGRTYVPDPEGHILNRHTPTDAGESNATPSS